MSGNAFEICGTAGAIRGGSALDKSTYSRVTNRDAVGYSTQKRYEPFVP